MRVAVMSDIHGFSLALERVAADLDARGPFAAVFVAGDLCEVGPDPAGVLERLRGRGWTLLQGNTDRDIVAAADGADHDPAVAYVLREIGPAGVDDLRRLPFSRRVTPPGAESPADDLLAVHANPHDLERKLTPEMSEREVAAVIGDARAGALAFGHHHVAFQRRLGPMLLCDVSAVGNPKDGDLRSRYAIFDWDEGRRSWTASHRYLPYPLEETAAQIRASGLPDPERTLRTLLEASY